MSPVLACVVKILHDDWSIRSGENRPDRVLTHLAAMLPRMQVRGGLTKSCVFSSLNNLRNNFLEIYQLGLAEELLKTCRKL